MKYTISLSNKKLSKDNIPSFNLPMGKTCICAGQCRKFCYVKKQYRLYKNVKPSHENNYKFSKSTKFIDLMTQEIKLLQAKNNIKYFRWMSSGDVYSKEYFIKLCKIAKNVPNITFYLYTKSHKLVKSNLRYKPDNFVIIYSLGSKDDRHVDLKRDKHARVFEKHEKIDKSYHVANSSDLIALNNNKIALIKH